MVLPHNPAMKASELDKLLRDEGCNPSSYSVLGSAHEAWCIDVRNGKWEIFFSERAEDFPPIFSSALEEEACEFFFKKVMSQPHWHSVGYFQSESDAVALEARLSEHEINWVRNVIPAYLKPNDPRYCVLVVGKDIFRYRSLFGEPKIEQA